MACCKCYLIDLDCLRKYTNVRIANGVLLEHFQRELLLSHEVHLIPVIGEVCFNELCEAKANDTLTQDQLNLLDKIYPFVALIIEFYYINNNIKHAAAGSILKEGSGYKQPSGDQIQNATRIIRKNIDFYESKLRKFLNDNAELFPCFEPECESSCNDDNKRFYKSNIKGV